MKSAIISIIIIVSFSLSAIDSTNMIYENWDRLIGSYVKSDFKQNIHYKAVNYQEINSQPEFAEILTNLQDFDITALKTRNQKLAFWINVYNIAAVKVVLENRITGSIRDAGNFLKPVWNNDAVNVGGRIYSLGEIEHKILRPLNEPLIHFGIVCASLSCPDLLEQSYRPETVIEQLENSTRSFLMNETKGIRIDESSRTLYVSSIFKWFKEDFEIGVIGFIQPYTDLDLTSMKLKYLSYNWDLNSPKE